MKFANPWSKAVVSVSQNVCAQSWPTVRDPMGCNPPGSSFPGISPPGILEWVAISFSRDLPSLGTKPVSPAAPALAGGSLPLSHPGSPQFLKARLIVALGVEGIGVPLGVCRWGQRCCSASSKAHRDLSGQRFNWSKMLRKTASFPSCSCVPLSCFLGEGNGTPLQYSCLENPMGRGAW